MIAPAPLVMLIFVPAVNVALVNVFPVLLPIRSWPLVYEVWPVPPLATGNVPVTPVVRGRPVALVRIAADGVPRFGVTRTGDVDKTTEPVPVDVVTPVPPRATDSVPVVPATMGSPVALVRVAAEGVPRFGVTRTGEVDKTTEPVPVDVVTPVPPLATGRRP